MPATQLAQKQVGVVTRIVDVLQNGRAAKLARVIDYDIAKTENPLRNRRRNSDVLDFESGTLRVVLAIKP